MRRLTDIFLFLLLSSHTVSSTSFRETLQRIQAAHDDAFHEGLLQQLAASRGNSSALPHLEISPPVYNLDAINVLSTNPTGSYADGSTSTFQIYTNTSLPRSPAPPSGCATALTTTLECNSTVQLMSPYPGLMLNDLPALCTPQCTSSLSSYRTNVLSACQGFQMILSNNISYAPTLPVDSIAGAYTVECLQDPTSDQYCAPLLASFNSSAGLLSLPNSELCTYCTLKTLNVTLSNPDRYSPALSQLLSSAITQCGSQFASYNVTNAAEGGSSSNPPFGVNSTMEPTAACSIVGYNISVTTDTTCSAIASANSITIASILFSNPFLVGSADCSVKAGTKLCLLQKCQLYQIATNDTCASIAAKSGSITGVNVTAIQLQSFNPELGTSCQMLSSRMGQSICLTPNGGFPNVSVSSGNNPTGTPTAVAPIPTPTVNGTTSNCGRYYQVKEGDICNTVVLANSISLADFLTINPEIDANCTNLWLNYYYCVAPYPALSTAPAVPTITSNYSEASTFIYTFPTSYTPSLVTITFPLPTGVSAPTNVANGTRTVGCNYYYTVLPGDTVDSIVMSWLINSAELIIWNPELATSDPAPGTAICVDFPTGNYTLAVAPALSNVAPNVTTSECAEYYTVVAGDSCTAIEQKFFIDNELFKSLNPAINSQCTNIVSGLSYCVLSIFPPDASAPTSPPSNVASGTITSGCTDYYTVATGDGCATIESKFNLTLPQFIAMNPEINSGCTNLVLADAYCVASSNSSTTTGPPGNVAAGTITAGCKEYYTVVSGDGCASIESKFNLTLAAFIGMNPEINSGCTNVELGAAYCVASSNNTITSGPPPNLATGSLSNCTAYWTVASGNTCASIDAAEHITLSDFLRWNTAVNTACTNMLLGAAYCVGGGGNACGKVYTVVSGDSCTTIVKSQKTTQAQLNALNPQINADCSNLEVGENLCVE